MKLTQAPTQGAETGGGNRGRVTPKTSGGASFFVVWVTAVTRIFTKTMHTQRDEHVQGKQHTPAVFSFF